MEMKPYRNDAVLATLLADEVLLDAFRTIQNLVQTSDGCAATAANLERIERLGRESAVIGHFASPVSELLRHEGPTHVVVLRTGNDFVQNLPPTPPGHSVMHKFLDLDIARIALIGAAGGYGYAFSSQARGNLCDDVMPVRSAHGLNGFSQGREVGWHTEDACFNGPNVNFASDVLSIAMLRNPNSDPLQVSIPDLKLLSAADRAVLEAPCFYIPVSVAHHTGDDPGRPRSLFYDNNKMRVSFATGVCSLAPVDDSIERRAVESLLDVLDAGCVRIDAQPGDIVFVDNMRCAHSRATWRKPPQYDGTDRWQRRLGFVAASRGAALAAGAVPGRDRVLDTERLRC